MIGRVMYSVPTEYPSMAGIRTTGDMPAMCARRVFKSPTTAPAVCSGTVMCSAIASALSVTEPT